MTTLAPTTSRLEAALRLARMGYVIIPLAPGTKDKPLVKWKTAATNDEEQVRAWWERWPDANIGLLTGEVNGFDVLDIDGDEGRANLRNLRLDLPPTYMVQTPGGGSHRYFKHHPGVRNSQGRLGKGIDIRGDGGYVCAPPSRRPEGSYRGRRLGSEPIYPMPEGLIALLEQLKSSSLEARREPEPQPIEGDDPRRAKAANTALRWASELDIGERNGGTFRLAVRLRNIATTEEEWEEYRERLLEVLPYGPGGGNGDFTEAEAERTIRNAENYVPELGSWEPSPFEFPSLTETRREILAAYAWAYAQPWPGRTGTYDRLGYRAVLRVAYRANKITDLGISVRELAEEIGTRSLKTASAVLRRLVAAGLLARREGQTFDDPYVYDLESVRKGNTLSTAPYEDIRLLPFCTSAGQMVPDAFRTPKGVPKTALLLLDYLDEPKTKRELEELSGKHRTTVTRNLKLLADVGLAIETEGKWAETGKSVNEVAIERGTHGAAERQRDYNREQRAIRDLRRNVA